MKKGDIVTIKNGTWAGYEGVVTHIFYTNFGFVASAYVVLEENGYNILCLREDLETEI